MGLPLTPLRSFYLECHSIFPRKAYGDATHLPEKFMEMTFGFPKEIRLTAIRFLREFRWGTMAMPPSALEYFMK